MGINIKSLTKQGFSLVQTSVLIGVAGIMLASVLPGGDLGSAIEKDLITKDKMEKIEEATRNFMAANLRRPCPADGTLAIGTANFGVEDTTSGRCSNANFYTQSSPLTKTGTTTTTSAVLTSLSDTTGLSIGMLVTNANLATDTHIASVDSATQITLDKYPTGAAVGTSLTFTTVAAGVVPTKTLGLPDDYMFDGYGRRIGYVVDVRATNRTTCRDMWVTKTPGNIQIVDSASATAATDNVMWSLISYGKNGHGAFPMQGSSIANRINSGATNDDEEINAFINTAGTFATAFTQKLVKHEPVATAGATYFDDTVWTNEATKNTCCTGKMCNLGTRIGGTVGEPLASFYVKTGDINGDGISDMIISEPLGTKIRIVFGRSTGWSPSGALSVETPNSSRFITITDDSALPNFLDGNNYGNMDGNSIGVGDLNGDGYDDIAMGYGNGTNARIKVFYGSANPVDTPTSAITDIITFPRTSDSNSPSIAIGHFAHTSHKDILALVKFASGAAASTAYVIYGNGGATVTATAGSNAAVPSLTKTAEAVTTVAATVGFKINTSAASWLRVMMQNTGDVNGDGYDDMVFGDYVNKRMHVLFGQSPADWNTDKTTAATGSTPDIVNIDTRVAAGPTEAIEFNNGGNYLSRYTSWIADVNGDGYSDIMTNSTYSDYTYVYYGKASGAWTSPVDLSNASNYNGTNGFRFNTITSMPTWMNFGFETTYMGDINNDGKLDMVLVDWWCYKGGLTDSGCSFVALQPNAGWSSVWSSGTINIFGNVFATGESGLPLNNDATKGFSIDGAYGDGRDVIQAFADIDGDGKTDIIVSEYENTNSPEVGNVYIYFGKTLVPWDSENGLIQLNRF